VYLGLESFKSYLDENLMFVPPDGTSRFLYEVWQPLVLLTATFLFTIGVFSPLKPSTKAPSPLFCDVNGNVQELGPTDEYRPIWDLSLFFTVNVPYGSFSFTRAKVIDACWDIGFGRGGQLVAGMLAYRTVRRSLTLTMEDSALLISTATSICCQQLQFVPLWELLRGVFVRPNRRPTPRSRSRLVGLTRRAAYVFVCIYVLVFATLTSVMTGYRAGLTGYFGYAANHDSTMRPLENLTRPDFVLYDASRINSTDNRISASSGMAASSSMAITPLYQTLKLCEFPLPLPNIFQADIPWSLDWSAYEELVSMHTGSKEGWPTETEINQICAGDASHDSLCSLSLPAGARGWDGIESNVSFGDAMFTLPAPPLDLRKMSIGTNGSSLQQQIGQDKFSYTNKSWTYNDTVFDDMEVRDSSVCIASDQYSWGFSSMLLLTFCIYTLLFSAALILLQAEVYWYSRSDRLDLSNSIYTDILFLADAIQARFGHGIWDIPVKELDKQVRDHRGGISVDVDKLPCSRMEMRTRRRKMVRKAQDAKMQQMATMSHVSDSDTSGLRFLSISHFDPLESRSRSVTGSVFLSSQDAEQSLTPASYHSKSQTSHKSNNDDSREEHATLSLLPKDFLYSGGLQDEGRVGQGYTNHSDPGTNSQLES
jgi:hypothetical protein